MDKDGFIIGNFFLILEVFYCCAIGTIHDKTNIVMLIQVLRFFERFGPFYSFFLRFFIVCVIVDIP
ncbi:hypothetical protein D3C71_1340690 [compost metagenome]